MLEWWSFGRSWAEIHSTRHITVTHRCLCMGFLPCVWPFCGGCLSLHVSLSPLYFCSQCRCVFIFSYPYHNLFSVHGNTVTVEPRVHNTCPSSSPHLFQASAYFWVVVDGCLGMFIHPSIHSSTQPPTHPFIHISFPRHAATLGEQRWEGLQLQKEPGKSMEIDRTTLLLKGVEYTVTLAER